MRTTDRSDGTLDTSAHHVLETRGIEPVPDAERHAKTRALLPTWIAANITVLLLTMGAALAVSYGLNFWQALAVGGVLMLVATSFLGSFIAFLSLLAVAFSAWVGVFGADKLRREAYDAGALLDTTRTSAYRYRGGFSPAAVAAWALGLGSGLLFSTSDWFTGPLASNNPVGEYGLGWVATVAVSFLLYAVLPKPAVAPVAQPAKGSATMAV
ncbi:cytosine permease [Streptomyces mirabilis]|uniref:cytosine permease n=1 Tax=Streptomyces mirabilis TaxID=68239 RepID=UPI0036436C1B